MKNIETNKGSKIIVEDANVKGVLNCDIKNGEWVDLETARKILHSHVNLLKKKYGK